jgi:azurin
MMFAAQAMHAQIGAGEVQLGVNTTTVSNGGTNATEALSTNTTYTVAISLQGVTGNGGSTSYSCYVTPSGGNTTLFFSGSVTQSSLITTQWTTGSEGTSYVWYCTASYGGQHVNGTVTTPTITVTT